MNFPAILRRKLAPQEPVIVRLETLPPSVNALYFNKPGKGRVKSDRYRTWLNAEGWNLRAQKSRWHSFTGPVGVEITTAEPKRKRDLDNAQKGVLDLLVSLQIIPDDNSDWVRDLRISISDDPKFEGVEVRIEPRRAG